MFTARFATMARGRVGLLLWVCGLACQRESTAPPVVASSTAPAELDAAYASYGLPGLTAPWSAADYLRVRDALVKIEREQPDLLPRIDGVGSAIFARWSALDAIVGVVADASIEGLLDLGDAMAAVFKLYAGRVAQGEAFGREYLGSVTVFVKLSVIQSARLLAALQLDAASLRAQPVRLEGVQKMRSGLAMVFLAALASPGEFPDRVDAGQCAGALAGVAAEVTQHLLPEERTQARGLTERLAKAGASSQDIAALQAAFAETQPRVAIVAELLAEHREFTARSQGVMASAVAGALTPIEVGAEQGGVRYAFPEAGAGFSAVFPQAPTAQRMVEPAADGVETTVRMLGGKQATGVSRVISCIDRASPLPGTTPQSQIDETIAGLKLRGVRDIEVDGVRGKEGEAEGSGGASRGLMRVLAVGDALCVIIVEYPVRLEGDVRGEARSFVDSFTLGPFRG